MARTTLTRKQLRKLICTELLMPFYQRFGETDITVSNYASKSVTVNALNQTNDFWNNQWIYIPEINFTDKIVDWVQSTHVLVLESGSDLITSGMSVEIIRDFSAVELHQAINRALGNSYPAFFDMTTNYTLVLCEDKLEYDLSNLSPAISRIASISVERPANNIYATVTQVEEVTVGSDTFCDMTVDVDTSEVTSDWLMSNYSTLTGGAWRNLVSSPSAGVVRVLTPLGTNIFFAGDKVMLWNPKVQEYHWDDLVDYNANAFEFPSWIQFHYLDDSFYGCRLLINYVKVPGGLAAEDDETIVPSGYAVPAALSLLAATRINDIRVDRQKWAIIQQQAAAEAQNFRELNYFRTTPTQYRNPKTHQSSRSDPNPMDW